MEAHGPQFESAINVTPLGNSRYSAFLQKAFCIGTVPHGGYTSAVLYRLALVHFATAHPELYKGEPATPISMHLTFLRRTEAGRAVLRVADVKLGRRTSSVHVELLQRSEKASPSEGGEEEDMEVKVAGYITVSPASAEVGISSRTEWSLHPAPIPGSRADGKVNLEELGKTGKDGLWRKINAPYPEFRKATTQAELYGPDPAQAQTPKRKNGIVDQWARLAPEGQGVRWSNEGVVFLTDLFPMALDGFDTMASEADSESGRTAMYWFPTVTLNIDFKRRVPVTGTEWLYSRVVTRDVCDGRTALDVTILDEMGAVVALSTQVGLVVSASRNIGKRARI